MPDSPNRLPANFPFGQSACWWPDPGATATSRLGRFMGRNGIPDLATLHRRSVDEPEWFWSAVLDDLGVRFREPYRQVMDTSAGLPFTRWCVGGRMNVVDSLLDRWVEAGSGDRTAFRFENEAGETARMSYAELLEAVSRCSGALRDLGVGRGDVVGLFLPMVPELAVVFLATVRIGAIVLPLFSGYGPDAVAARLRDSGARLLVTCDGARRRGRSAPMKPVADEALASCPDVGRVLVVRVTGEPVAMRPDRDTWWHELVYGHPPDGPSADTAAEDPLMIIYTSGTTGRPKGAVHTHCGFPVKAAQDMMHAMDLRQDEVMWWMTDMGWMMGPWLVFGTLMAGASMLFYDGSPDWPDPGRPWAVVERHGVTHLGLSPVLVRSLQTHGTDPVRRHDLSSLRAAASTGSPWDPDAWTWLFRDVLGGTRPILNYSGGTEISGGIVCGNFLTPLKPCSFSGPVPGMHADVVDDQGRSVRGTVGELVLRGPWIGMTRGFWRDPERYLETYWSRFDDVWLHGDFAAVDDDGLWYILGRSDDTLKIAGKRVGPSEVESVLNADPAVLDSVAIGVPDDVKGEALVVVCVLRPGRAPDENLRTRLVSLLTDRLGKPLAPRALRFADTLPKTRNGKVMRRLVRSAWLGLDPGDVSSLEDPDALDAIRRAV